jgi:two-component system, chemotaxis family, chemotaxis protein CheY
MQALVVDDSKIVRKVTRNILEPLGFAVDEAEDGRVAFEYCKSKMPALIMMDHNMPEMTGLDSVKAIRGLSGGDAPVIVMCTTMNDMDFIMSAMTNGANEFVMKPYDADIIKGKLEQLGVLPEQAG